MSAGIGRVARLDPGLYLVATPIGNARDITLRALDTLAGADVIAAEDTRTARRLMNMHAIALGERPLLSYHDHSKAPARARLLHEIEQGRSVAYVSEAGSPLVADPGFALAREAALRGLPVTSVPGPTAMIAALSVSGLASDRFLFAGFLPNASGARKKVLGELADVPATLIFFESAKRIHKSLDDMVLILGGTRQGAICRELTKKFEETLRGPLDELRQQVDARTLKGEIVVVLGRGTGRASVQDMEAALREALRTMSVKDAAAHVAGRLDLPRRQVYQAALSLGKTR